MVLILVVVIPASISLLVKLNRTNKTPVNQQVQESALDMTTIPKFVTVPTYHHAIPGSLKNFLELVNIKELFANNSIGVISSNKSGMDGARMTIQALNGYIAYNKLPVAYVIPDIPVIDFDSPDKDRLADFVERLLDFAGSHK